MRNTLTLAGAVTLPDWGIIHANGDDAAMFLHSQLSNDIKGVDAFHARLAAYCTAKGRMLSTLIVTASPDPSDENGYWLACHASVLTQTLKRLQMFVLRSHVRLKDAGETLTSVGISGPLPSNTAANASPNSSWGAQPSHDGNLIRLPNGAGQARWLWIGPKARASQVTSEHASLTLAQWHWLEVQSAVVPVTASTAERFVPQMINYELVGGVDFKKGCYPGQEIVARSQYLGKLKRRGHLMHCGVDIKAGMEVFSDADANQPCGVVAMTAPHPTGGWDALVEVKIAALKAGNLCLGSPTGPLLSPMSMPYAMPADPP